MTPILRKRPWLWIIVAFLLLIGAWTGLIMIAVKNKPQSIELEPPPPKEQEP